MLLQEVKDMATISTWPDVLDKDVVIPKLQDIELLSDGWIKKYLLTYKLPDGSTYKYESVSRKGLAEYTAALDQMNKESSLNPMRSVSCPFCPTILFFSFANFAIR